MKRVKKIKSKLQLIIKKNNNLRNQQWIIMKREDDDYKIGFTKLKN